MGLKKLYILAAILATTSVISPIAHATSGDEALVKRKVMKLWNQPDVQQLWKKTQENLNVLNNKADDLSEGALSAFQRQWLFQTKAFMDEFYASDLPRKLSTGDWSIREEVLFLLTGKTQAEHKAEMFNLEQEMLNAVKDGEITIDQFLALLKTLYEENLAPEEEAPATDG